MECKHEKLIGWKCPESGKILAKQCEDCKQEWLWVGETEEWIWIGVRKYSNSLEKPN